jgi:hypothetical protein
MDDNSDEFIADEGVPAIAVLTLFYRDYQTLMDMSIIKKKRGLSELSTQLSSPQRDSIRMVSFQELEHDLEVDKENFVRPKPKKLCLETDVARRDIVDLDEDLAVLKEEVPPSHSILNRATDVEKEEEPDLISLEEEAIQQLCMIGGGRPPSPFRKRIPVHFQEQIYRITVDKDTSEESIRKMVTQLCTGRMEFEYDDDQLTDIRVF